MSKKVKIFAIIILVISGAVFFATKSSGPVAPAGSLSSTENQGKVVMTGSSSDEAPTSDFSTLLSSIKTINIDTSVLNSDAYRSLRDYPVSLGTDTVGRNNPFAPIGSDINDPVLSTTEDEPVAQTQTPATTPTAAPAATPAQASGATISSGPSIQTLQPGKITKTSAEFGAQVTLTDTVPVIVIFQYGLTDKFESVTAPVTVDKSGTALVTVTNLQQKTGYKIRAVMVKGSTPINGNIVSFSTL